MLYEETLKEFKKEFGIHRFVGNHTKKIQSI